tara:strand:- start:3943 stop:4773 length:831 start_codon:yes stop_codon:yes gene_type:complete
MVVEIIAGYITGSMALLADGWHMASHAAALTLTLIVYKMARSQKLQQHLSFGTGKLMPLGGYTSALGLALVSIFMAWESLERISQPIPINFDEALWVAVIGLVVNIICALLLGHSHDHDDDHHHDHDHDHDHEHHGEDHNHQGALVHVIADALTSVAAIIALIVGKYQGYVWLDPLMGIIGSVLILKWAYKLLKETAWELLDGHAKKINADDLRSDLEVDHANVVDLHIWRIGPSGVSVQLIITNNTRLGSEHYKAIVHKRIPGAHIVVEERLSEH